MKTSHKLLFGTALVALMALLAQLFVPPDNQDGQRKTGSGAIVENAAEPPAGKAPATALQTSTQRGPTQISAQMYERYGNRYAVHEMNASDLREGERIHLGAYLVKGSVKKELGITSLGSESYHSKSHLAVAIADGKTMIERWGNDGYTGNSWRLEDEVQKECQSLNWPTERHVITIRDEGDTQRLGTTGGGWNVMIEFWRFTPTRKDA